ncbi:MAG TPA: translocation/assembly module TamB domain-containing protein [Bryobacteraceae bacterium]|nr:translocation/assembly module TamB domain-containing protein [Bryobacteraceae bacterium]
MTRPVKIGLSIGGGLVGLLLLVVVAALLILPSHWFAEKVRQRLVAEVETASGGKAEIGAFKVDWKTLTADVRPFILHGTEPASEKPLFRAESITLGIKIISLMKKQFDLASLTLDKPEINLLVDANGHTNFPEPKLKHASEKDPIETILDLAIKVFTINNGYLYYADQHIPLNVRGENLNAVFNYDVSGPRYAGKISMRQLHLNTSDILPLAFDFDSTLGIERNRFLIGGATLAMKESHIDLAGSITNFKDPQIVFDVKAVGSMAELGKPFKLPPPHVGNVSFIGKATYSSGSSYLLEGKVSGHGLAVKESGFSLANIGVDTDLRFGPHEVLLRGVRMTALDGTFLGMVEIKDMKQYKVNGEVHGLSVKSLARLQGVQKVPWNGSVSGPVEITGTIGAANDLKAGARLKISPVRGGTPLEGKLDVAYDQRNASLKLGNSFIATPATRIDFAGTLGDNLQINIQSNDLNDILPVLAMGSKDAPKELPVKLDPGGLASFQGTVVGKLADPRVNGSLTVTQFTVQEQKVDKLVAEFDATKSGARIRSLALGQDTLRLEGAADITLTNWKLNDANPVSGSVKLRGAQLGKLLAKAGQNLPIDGLLTADITLRGTAGNPQATILVNIDKPALYGEKFDRLHAEVRYAGGGVEVINGVVQLGSARILLAGAYEHPLNDWKNGKLRFDATSQGFTLSQLDNIQKFRPGMKGRFALKVVGNANVHDAEPLLTSLNGQLALQDLIVDGKPIGDFAVDAATSGAQLNVGVSGNLRGSTVRGNGVFQLAGDYPGSGSLEFSPLSFSTINDLASSTTPVQPLPAEGFISGKITFSGPARTPDLMHIRMEVPTLEVVPVQKTRTPQQNRELALRNGKPIVLEMDEKGIHIRSAQLVGRDTNIEASGTVNLKDKSPWDLRVNGTLNLAMLQDFNSDLLAAGNSTINASVRGSLSDPQVNGRLELKDASFYLADMPNGLDKANGLILFDKNRATIDHLTAQTGGGEISATGFVGFGTQMTYQLQARGNNVRVRYPEGVSTTLNATLTVTGSTDRSLLSGLVTIRRAGFNPHADVGGILQASAQPIATPTTPNEILRNMQLDVRVETVPNLQLQTSLTSDLQAEANLRVRGTAAKPVVLGRVTVNQGEIQFFGNKYTINRGEIGFYNPVRIEPILDMDVETKVRGVDVNINFSGSINKLNVSYRSDPPLQTNEIIAVLAFGRAPGSNTSLASSQTVSSQSFLATGTNSLLGQAIATPVSNRLQRFFGVSRLKIDPQLTGIDAIPQARLTLEQQISKDITLTYITNLTNTNQQIVRVEWNLNKTLSLVAVREENGLFGVDFLYKKRFK